MSVGAFEPSSFSDAATVFAVALASARVAGVAVVFERARARKPNAIMLRAFLTAFGIEPLQLGQRRGRLFADVARLLARDRQIRHHRRRT